jgi:hypothetical protein
MVTNNPRPPVCQRYVQQIHLSHYILNAWGQMHNSSTPIVFPGVLFQLLHFEMMGLINSLKAQSSMTYSIASIVLTIGLVEPD